MNIILKIGLLAIGLSMDAFAAAVCIGLAMQNVAFPQMLTVGMYFGAFQAGMPIIGYLFAELFAAHVEAYSQWIAFALLSFLGAKMIRASFMKDKKCTIPDTSLRPSAMVPLAFATSVDAMAVGVTFALLKTSILLPAIMIGVTTLCLSMFGVKVGGTFGRRFKSHAEFVGGLVLVAIGLRILYSG